jgi:hypothetical protein
MPVGDQPICSEDEIWRIDPVWQFENVPNGFWKKRRNRRNYLLWLGRKLRFRRMKDWYRLTTADFLRHPGGALLLDYRSSVSDAVTVSFPGRDWKPWMFERAPNKFWQSRANGRMYLNWLGKRMGYKRLDDWYALKAADIKQNHGRMLLRRYRDSVAAMVIDLILRRKWCEWKFTRVPIDFWDSAENRRSYVLWLGKQLGYRRTEDWRRVRKNDFYEHCGGSLLVMYHSIGNLLAECMPELEYKPRRKQPLVLR